MWIIKRIIIKLAKGWIGGGSDNHEGKLVLII